jgi:hypothetical protein
MPQAAAPVLPKTAIKLISGDYPAKASLKITPLFPGRLLFFSTDVSSRSK